MKDNDPSADEYFELGKRLIRDGDLENGTNCIAAAAMEGHVEAKAINKVIVERRTSEQQKVLRWTQQWLLVWLQGAKSPLNDSTKRRQPKPEADHD